MKIVVAFVMGMVVLTLVIASIQTDDAYAKCMSERYRRG